MPTTPPSFRTPLSALTVRLKGRSPDTALDDGFDRKGGGIRHGRICEPAEDLHGLPVDVVDPRVAA